MTSQRESLIRRVEGRAVPVPGTYTFDPNHTRVDVEATHLMVTKVRGGFETVAGTIEVADDVSASKVDFTIDAASINTRTPDRDTHLRSADFLDVENYPTIRFVGSRVESAGDKWKLEGDLTIKDVTRTVTLDLQFQGVVTDPWGNERLAFSAQTELLREDWGLSWNVPLEGGGVLVSHALKVDIEAQALPT